MSSNDLPPWLYRLLLYLLLSRQHRHGHHFTTLHRGDDCTGDGPGGGTWSTGGTTTTQGTTTSGTTTTSFGSNQGTSPGNSGFGHQRRHHHHR